MLISWLIELRPQDTFGFQLIIVPRQCIFQEVIPIRYVTSAVMSLGEFPVLGIPASEGPANDCGDVTVINHDIAHAEIGVGEESLVFLYVAFNNVGTESIGCLVEGDMAAEQGVEVGMCTVRTEWRGSYACVS